MKQGDFSGLAGLYSAYRPGYSRNWVTLLRRLLKAGGSEPRIADIGSGTGIWTRMLCDLGPGELRAVEPNDDMRRQGEADSVGLPIVWQPGSAEATGLADGSFDLVTMASSFHWADFDRAMAEFHRIAAPGGLFFCLWNARNLAKMPRIREIEDYQHRLGAGVERRSSGSSAYVEALADKLRQSACVADCIYVECERVERQTVDRYVNAWRSSNDVQAQLGAEKFAKFVAHLRRELASTSTIDVHYRDRGWLCFLAK